MVYTEVQRRGRKKYYYRTVSVREGEKVSKKRIFMGSDLSGEELTLAEAEADRELGVLEALLTEEDIARLDAVKKRYSKLEPSTQKNRYEVFTTQFTYDSTTIEGNTLSLQEAGNLLFENITPKGKNLREINEVLGHKKAFDFILEYDRDITREFIMQLHRQVMEGAAPEEYADQIGQYRKVQVYIRGTDWMPPAPEDVQEDMASLLSWYSKNRDNLHPLVIAVYFHIGFEIVHPFIDGNGRVGRLLLNFILHRNGYPMVNILSEERQEYYDALQMAQMNGDLRPFIDLTIRLLEEAKVML